MKNLKYYLLGILAVVIIVAWIGFGVFQAGSAIIDLLFNEHDSWTWIGLIIVTVMGVYAFKEVMDR